MDFAYITLLLSVCSKANTQTAAANSSSGSGDVLHKRILEFAFTLSRLLFASSERNTPFPLVKKCRSTIP